MSKFKDLQPEVCETIESEAPKKICPTCKPNPSYIEPTWWKTEEPYLNKKICEYQVNIISTQQVTGLSQNEIKYEAQKVVKKGIRSILRHLGKLETNDIVCAFPPQKGGQGCRLYIPPNLLIKLELEDIDNLQIIDNIVYNKEDPDKRLNSDAIEVAAKVSDIYYGDNFETFQILVSVPAEAIDVIPESPFTNEDQEDLEDDAENVEEVILDGYDFRGNIRKLKAAFFLYSKYQTAFSYIQNIKLTQLVDGSYRPFYLKKYRDRLQTFSDELRKAIKKYGYRLTSVKSRKTVEKIKIRFIKGETLRIKSIFIKKKGCSYERLRGISKLKSTDQTTMNYIINLDKMINELSFSGEDVPWLDFTAEYTYPALEINFGDIESNQELLNSCINQESVDNLKDNVLRGLLSFSETIQFTLSTNECKTLRDIAENNPYEKQRINLQESLKKANKRFKSLKNNFKSKKSQLTVNNLKDITKEFYEDNRKEASLTDLMFDQGGLQDNIFNSLNPCKWDQVSMKVIECLLGGMSFADAVPLIIKSVLRNSNPYVLENLFIGLSMEERKRVSGRVKEEVSKISEDFSQTYKEPWELQREKDKQSENADSSGDRQDILDKIRESSTESNPSQGNIANVVFDAYVEAISNEISIDRLVGLMDDIPGANIFKKLLIEAMCPKVNHLKSGIKDLFGSLKVEFCDPNAKNFFLPSIPDLPKFRSIGLRLALETLSDTFKDALVELLSQLLLALVIRIIDQIESGLCNTIGSLGALIANALTGQKGKDSFLDAVNDAFCENESARVDTANDLLGKAGIAAGKRLEIANALSSAATSNEIKQALVSDCDDQNPKVMKAIWAVLKASNLKLNGMFESPNDVRDLFCLMGSYLTDGQRRAVLVSLTENDRPINPSICLTNDERDEWDQNRISFYEDQGLDQAAAEEFVDGLNKKMNSDLSDMLDSLAKGPEGLLEDALLQALAPRDPDCVDATNSIMPPMPEELKNIMGQISDGVFGSLAFSFTKDMFGGAKSFFDNVLADQRGVRLSYGFFSHERRVGFDLVYPNAANDEDEHASKLDQAGPIEKRLMEGFDGKSEPDHLFPQTIGLYLHQQYMDQSENQFEITTSKQGRQKKPDLLLQFRNQTDKVGLEFDFGFNLAYLHFTNPDNQVKSDECVIRKLDVVKTRNSTSRNIDARITSNHGVNKYPEQLGKYDLDQSELSLPYVVELFGNVLKDRFSKTGATGISKNDIEKAFNSINNVIYKGLSKALVTDERQEENYPMGYLFGYNNDKITYEDLLYVNPEATDDERTWEYTYEEDQGVLGKSATGNKRVKFLDPAKYGGRYTKPKLYIEPVRHDGWFRISQIIIPEIDGCDPRRTDFLFLDQISGKVSNLQNRIKIDKRAELEPDCVYEPAYDKLMTPSSHAYIEGINTATIRAYALETMLRCMPIISQLKLDFSTNYSDLFCSFIIDKMEDTMQEQGTWPRRIRDYKYWTAFLDQIVQSSFRMLERGDLEPDQGLVDLMQQALEVSKSYTRPSIADRKRLFKVNTYTVDSSGKIVDCEFSDIQVSQKLKNRTIKHLNAMAFEAFGKDYRKELLELDKKTAKFKTLRLQVLKDAEREYDIHENVDLAKKILKYHIVKELEFYAEQFQQAFIPQVYINNINKFLLGASGIPIVSDTQAGLSEIEDPVGESAIPNYGTIPSVPSGNESPFENLSQEEIQNAKEFGGLFLQKYIIATPNEERTIDLEGMISFSQFRTAIGDFTGDKTQYISEVLGDAVVSEDSGSYSGTIGVKMGVRVCYLLPEGIDPFSSDEELAAATTAINQDKAYFTNDDNGLQYFVPLANFEQDIVDRKLEDINIDDDNFDEDIKCYFDKMIETDEFKFIFQSLLITNKVPSLMAIYSYDGFINSIGLGDGEREPKSEGPNRNSFGMEVGWEGKILDDTKKRLLDLFSSYYLKHEKNKDAKQKRERDRKKFLKNLLPDSILNFDRNVRWWQLRRLQDRPFDKDGKDCADTLASVFKGE